MNFRPDVHDRQYRDVMRGLADQYGWPEMQALRAEIDGLAIERYSPSFQQRLCEAGLIGVSWPEPYGSGAPFDQQLRGNPPRHFRPHSFFPAFRSLGTDHDQGFPRQQRLRVLDLLVVSP